MSAHALVLSSDAKAARVLRDALTEADFSVDVCRNVASTLESLTSENYSIVVVDVADSRERDGLLRQLRCTPLNKNALAIAILGVSGQAASAFALGANLVLYRPLAPDRVQSSVRAAAKLIHRDKRRDKRLPVHAEADLSCPTVESAPATLLDLSKDGLSLQCDRPVPAQSKIYLRFTLPGQTQSVRLSGETMWQDANGRAGIRFVAVPQMARRLLSEWMESKLSLRYSKVRIELPLGQRLGAANARADRRSESRHSCRLGVDVYRADQRVPHRCVLTDISIGGFYVEMTSPFPVGTAVEIVVRTQQFKFTSAGTVQKVDRGYGMGVAFATQTPSQQAQVRELIKLAFRERAAEGDPIITL